MKSQIDIKFDNLDSRIKLLLQRKESSADIKLQERLIHKEQECEELKQVCMFIAERLRHTMLIMKQMLEDAD